MIRSRCRAGFTLIELLTVVAIILILAGLIMTAVFGAVEAGRIADCRSNLSQLHKLLLQYANTYGNYLPAFWHERWCGELGLVGKAWGNMKDDLNPKIAPVWNNLSPAQNWIGEERTLRRSGAPILVCKSDTSHYICDQGNLVSYMGLAKYGWWYRNDTGARNPYSEYHQIQEFDNTSKRILLAETEPGTWQLGNCGCRWHAYRHPVYVVERHYHGGHILFFDGHIELVKGARARPYGTGTVTDNMIRYWEEDYDQTDPEW